MNKKFLVFRGTGNLYIYTFRGISCVTCCKRSVKYNNLVFSIEYKGFNKFEIFNLYTMKIVNSLSTADAESASRGSRTSRARSSGVI